MELYRKELKLAVIKGLDESRGSSNVTIKLTHDTSDEYINYTEQIHIRYLFDNQVKEEILPTNDTGFYIPGKPLSHDGPIELAVHLINGDIELVTNELSFIVKNAPNGTTQVDPSEFTWQQLVDQYVNAKLETFADKADMNKFKDDVNANLSNQDKKITDLQNTTKVSLDSQNTKIDNFKSEVNTSLSNQNTSINQTTNAQNSKIATLESRMNTFTRLSEGSTTGDAELQDIRVGANGITYNNAGDAVRGQYSQLKEDLAELNTIRKKIKSIDGYISADGIIKQSTISKVYYFECEQNTLYYFNANKITKLPDYENFIIGELSNDVFIGANVGGIHSSKDLVKTYASSGNAKYICFCIPRISKNVFFVEELYKIRQNQSDNNEINIIDNMRVSFYDINNDGHYEEIIIARDDDFIITDYIEITNDTLLFEYGYDNNGSLSAVACFDSNKKFLYCYTIDNDRKISFKSEVKYIIATVPKIKGANISKNDGSIVFIYNDFNFNYLKLKEKMDYIQNGSDYLHPIFAFCSPLENQNEYIAIRNDRISTLDYIKTNGNSFKFVIPKGLKMYLWQYRDDFSYIQSGYGHEGIVTIKPIGAYIRCSFKTLDDSDISMDMLNDFSLSNIDKSIIEEIPNTYPEEVGYRKSEQWVNLKWTPKNKVPMQGGASYFPANIERIGMLYGEGAYQDKRVGADVSLRTFMTAINNPYSLMYTENTNENHSQSAYGITYYGDYNSGAYMGMSCNIFVYNVLGSHITWSSFETDGGSAIDENIVEKVYDQSSHGLRLMDILATQGHVRIVSRLWRNKRNVVKKIQVSEIVGSGAINVLYSDTEFDSFLKNNNYRIYRFKELYKNIDYEQSPFVTLDDEDVLSYTYNNDICTFAGDYASFAEGDLIHINYEKGIYTSMQIYKDDNLIDTIAIGEGHDVDLTNKNYSYGKYKARLTDGTNHSDFTYWEILNLEISLNGEELTYSSENGRPVFWSWCEYRGWHKHKHSLVGEDSHKTINVGNRPDSTYKYIKVYVDGEYGRIARRLVVE